MGGQVVLCVNWTRTLGALEHPRWSKHQPDASLTFTPSCFTGSVAAGLAVVLWLRRCFQMFAVNKTLQRSTQNTTALGLLVQLCADYSGHRPPPTPDCLLYYRRKIWNSWSPESWKGGRDLKSHTAHCVLKKKKKVSLDYTQSDLLGLRERWLKQRIGNIKLSSFKDKQKQSFGRQ